jgi:uracil permease
MNSITRKEGITNARELGMPKYIILGVQHLFAMFGATILVPVLTGLSVSSTLLFAGIGTHHQLAASHHSCGNGN